MANNEIAVQFDSVSFSYGDVVVLENASFHIHRGEFAALVGPNGSGKTTVLKLILGLEQPATGRITLLGDAQEVRISPLSTRSFTEKKTKANQNYAAGRGRIGYVPQQPPADRAFPVTVHDVVRMGLLSPSRGYGADARSAAVTAMEQTDIAELAARPWRALSGGQRRRVLVARALVSRPELLILDEPTANMDAESEERLFETLGKLKGDTTILIVTHDMNFVSALTGRVLCLGDDAHRRGIVQHPTAADTNRHEDSPLQAHVLQARVLHGENIPADDCCEPL
jgi:zinc transport system ATP-binding protein